MFEVSNNNIKITKGDSAALNVDLKSNDGTPYILEDGDTLTLTVKKDLDKSEYLMQVKSTTNEIILNSEDTKKLIVGGLYYDIQLDTSDGKVYTVVGVTSSYPNLIVYAEVTE